MIPSRPIIFLFILSVLLCSHSSNAQDVTELFFVNSTGPSNQDGPFSEEFNLSISDRIKKARNNLEDESSSIEAKLYATNLLKSAAQENSTDAMLLLANIMFFGIYSFEPDFQMAHTYYDHLQKTNGSVVGNLMLGFYHSVSYYNTVSYDPALSRLYWEAAAKQGSLDAHQFLAYHHFTGMHTERSYLLAAKHYKLIADDLTKEGPKSLLASSRYLWPEILDYNSAGDDGTGVYGPASAYAFSPVSRAFQSIRHYYREILNPPEEWDLGILFEVGKLRLHGMYSFQRNHTLAEAIFAKVFRGLSSLSESSVHVTSENVVDLVSKSAGYIGLAQVFGDSKRENVKNATHWLKRGIFHNDSNSLYGMGYLFYHGLLNESERDVEKGLSYMKKAADMKNGYALTFLGVLSMEYEDFDSAVHYLTLANKENVLLASKLLADCYFNGIGTPVSKRKAALLYKEFVEAVRSSSSTMNLAMREADYDCSENSLMYYLYSAQMGYSIAETNAAYLVDGNKYLINSLKRYLYPEISGEESLSDDFAYEFYARAAAQGDADAILKLGDYFYYGIGVQKDYEKAYKYYEIASEKGGATGMALWNMAYMHEYGRGRERDTHIAKRYLDELSVNQIAYIPFRLIISLVFLHRFYLKCLSFLRLR
ncbi:hypothetical protein SPOG_01890 [Schizosaccharomyces cryophilus OY26]|uniref:Ubiquitin-protein ligase Sel1/Ubx2 n=1 Tax=Schizosaccharomyces cryophilus (strain OY26 / ATCC MYA-4695 / CBS 11777 / NBRC 106824 / NRRL Y48691) TaxID=653667 RepID=S9W3Q5_SCHCR|nr:uncharacterized protein SPOG_01890 [Schizosaccharomyces cryophilus OY26]EPY52570.1 hypothetical protein SPOG_01890 [Schizosaccharomyces cryophilus OY26]